MALHRARLACGVAKDALNGEIAPPENTTTVEYAIYGLACAIENIAQAMEAERD
jgi:hypothetical protein